MVSDNYRITSDYAGFAQDYFELAHKGVKAMFLMGCGGDQNAYPRGTEDLSSLHGRALATAVDAALLPAAQPVTGPLRMALEDVPLAFDRMNKEQLLASQASTPKPETRQTLDVGLCPIYCLVGQRYFYAEIREITGFSDL